MVVTGGKEGMGGGSMPIWRRPMQIQRVALTESPYIAALVGPHMICQKDGRCSCTVSEKGVPDDKSVGNKMKRMKQERL